MKYVKNFKRNDKKLSMVTCYDYTFAKLINQTEVDCILVGDSLGMVVYGHENTLSVTTEMMKLHTEAVKRGCPDKIIISDMPFLSTRKGIPYAMEVAHQLMSAGSSGIKVEGVIGQEQVISSLVQSGIPVMGHLGLTPQYYQSLGGFRVQGRDKKSFEEIIHQALVLEDLGVFSIVLECVPNSLAKQIQEKLSIPIIGIGAGVDVDGQVLVLHDLLGLSSDQFKFVRDFSSLNSKVIEGINSYVKEVNQKSFPNLEESFQ